jgi:acetolactate synthase-1/2/3 large subunit
MKSEKKYSDVITDLLIDSGYSTVFFVAGGNIMHLIESFSHRLKMIPVMHEVNAVIAADYFNATAEPNVGKALALVTVGPGVTNTTTGVAGAFIDGREVLVIGGQVKSSDLKTDTQRQNGIQEADGVSILKSITKKSVLLDSPIDSQLLKEILEISHTGRPGPVYIEICLDVQGANVFSENYSIAHNLISEPENVVIYDEVNYIIEKLSASKRPLFLIGGGVSRSLAGKCLEYFEKIRIPIATTWGGIDRIHSGHALYAGRPNTFGQRWANVYLQQADLLIVLGSSLGLQQTGFNTQEFLPLGDIIHLDIDPEVLQTSPFKDKKNIQIDLHKYLRTILEIMQNNMKFEEDWTEWLEFKDTLKLELPLVEDATQNGRGVINPFQYVYDISQITSCEHAIVTCSSGGTYTSFMQTFQNQPKQVVMSSKGLGSMGIGPGGAIGTQIATGKKTLLFDGDGGFIQNSQELGVISARKLPIKIFVFSNDGYSSIRTTQKKYFSGNYVGCDASTGLGFPNLELYAASFGILFYRSEAELDFGKMNEILNDNNPWLIEVIVDSDQEYLPKINSRITQGGSMESNPLHKMWPELSEGQSSVVFKYLINTGMGER